MMQLFFLTVLNKIVLYNSYIFYIENNIKKINKFLVFINYLNTLNITYTLF